jgi:immune inhibitor A
MIPPNATDGDIQSLVQRFPNLDMARSFSFGPSLDAVTGQAETFRLLTILVKFTDKANSVGESNFSSFIYGTSGNSVHVYYDEVSYGNLDIVTVNLPGTTGWFTAPQTYNYYASSNNCLGSYPTNCQKLAEDLATLVNPVVDFSQYDNDGDGFVDAILIVHAGRGAEWASTAGDIWSHQWSTVSQPLVDGVRVSTYVTAPEFWVSPGDITIGVYVHELAHAFGLPDYYDVDQTSLGIGDWSLMAYGSWNTRFPQVYRTRAPCHH